MSWKAVPSVSLTDSLSHIDPPPLPYLTPPPSSLSFSPSSTPPPPRPQLPHWLPPPSLTTPSSLTDHPFLPHWPPLPPSLTTLLPHWPPSSLTDSPVYLYWPQGMQSMSMRFNNAEVVFLSFFHVALRPRRRDGLLRTGTEWEGDDRVKARPRKPPEKDRRDCGPPPEQWKC